jgi:hypothetical protein
MGWDNIVEKEWPVILQAPFTFFIAFVLMCVFILWMLNKYYQHSVEMKEDMIKNLKRKLDNLENAPNDMPATTHKLSSGIEFFPTIDDLRSHHPLPETFRPGNEIHAYFLSGEGVFSEHSDYIKYVKRLILPDPSSENVAAIQAFSNGSNDYKHQILKYRGLAKNYHIPVRLFRTFSGTSLLFCNPEQQNGWVHLGPIVPGAEPYDRHHYRLYRAIREKAFLALYKTFNTLWEESQELSSDERKGINPDTPPAFISLRDASAKLYARCRLLNSEWARVAERLSGEGAGRGNSDDILDYMAGIISNKKDVYGTPAPSIYREKIRKEFLKRSLFINGATRLEHSVTGKSNFTNLEMQVSELNGLMEEMGFEVSLIDNRHESDH